MSELKRSRSEFENDPVNEVTATPDGETSGLPSQTTSEKETGTNGQLDGTESGEWQKVERANKKRKKLPKKDGNYPTITHSPNSRLQNYVKIHDLQNLVLYLLADGTSPQWCAVKHHGNIRKVVTLMVPGLEKGMFNGKIPFLSEEETNKEETSGDSSEVEKKNDTTTDEPSEKKRKYQPTPDDYYPTKLQHSRLPEPLQPLSDVFEHIWPIKTPGEDRNSRMHSPLAAMLTTPLVKSKEEKKAKGPQFPTEGKNWQNKRTPATEFLLTSAELAEEGYALHPAHYTGVSSAEHEMEKRETNKTTVAHGWVDVPGIPDLESGKAADKDIEQGSVTNGRNVLTMDCEMCITSPKGVTPQVFSLTRVSVIDWDGKTVMDEFVKPADPITDYLTPYSGITAEMLEGVTTTLEDIQKRLTEMLTPQSILVGHSLNSDLNALRMTFPFIIDTALLYPHPRGPPLKSSLKFLAQKYLAREIQKGHGSSGHNSIEDARTCLDLVKQKCEKGKTWGTSEASGESLFKRLSRTIRPKKAKANMSGPDEERTGAVVDYGEPSRGYGSSAKVAIGCESDAAIVTGIQRALTGSDPADPVDPVVPTGGCDLVWARLRELEAHRGFWNRSKALDSDALRTSTADASAAATLADVTQQTVEHICAIYEALPPCTAFVVYSGSGDMRELSEMQEMQKKFKEEYRVKKWDQLSVRWTDVEEQKLRKACEKARMGCGFVTVK